MVETLLWILLGGLFGGQLVRQLKGPPLLGMVIAGIALGPQAANVLGAGVLDAADSLRTIAVMVILMKAGLGLDREKLMQQGSVVLRLGFLPAACEAIVVAIAAIILFQFNPMTGLLLGCIVAAESPAVIVPGMLRLKQLGWGVKKGIPDAILTGSALSDVLLLLVFSLLMSLLTQSETAGLFIDRLTLSPWLILPIKVVVQVLLGVLIGALSARCVVGLLAARRWTQTTVQDVLIAAGLALWLILLAQTLPVFSGYLAVMAMGFFVTELQAPLARRLRLGFNSLWGVAEIVLFVLLGASVQIDVLESTLLPGLLLLAVGTLLGRSVGWYLSTLGSNWTMRERLFLLPGNSAKATVQAAIGGIPLAQGVAGGEVILAIAALSILVTAPLGAWAIPTFAPKLLERGEIDPTKVAIAHRPIILAAVDTSPIATKVLTKAAELARYNGGDVIVLHVAQQADLDAQIKLRAQTKKSLADIRHQFVESTGSVSTAILQTAQHYSVSEIVIGKYGERTAKACPSETCLSKTDLAQPPMGSIALTVIESSKLSVIIV
ncbi:MAG: cation:proton antiporter [Cyanobacteria bacterium J06627_28]